MKRIGAWFAAWLIVLVCAGACGASGEGAATLYNQGNAFYAKGDYESAVKNYRHALDQRVADPRLEQNIGSAYLKAGDVGRAILHFERGLLLAPRDADLRYNLKHAQTLRLDEIPENALFVTRMFAWLLRSFTPGELVGAASAVFVVMCLALLLINVIQGRARPVVAWCAAGLALLFMLVAPLGVARLIGDARIVRAIVVAPEVAAHAGPGEKESEVFMVHAGMPCELSERRAGWVKATIATGLTGWMPRQSAMAIRFDSAEAEK